MQHYSQTLQNHTQYMVVIEQGATSFGAFVPDLPGCIAVGETRDEAIALIREAVQFHLEDLREEGFVIPAPASSSAFIDVAMTA
jgi:predicted RNase H-like HicB family nuclease